MKILFAILLFLPLSITAQPKAPVGQPALPKDKVEAFFVSLDKGDIAGAYERIFFGSGMSEKKPDTLAMLKLQTESGLSHYGKILGPDFVKEEKFGTSIVRLVYVLKSEVFPTEWEFYFYKPKDSWFLASVKFNDQFDLLR